MLGRHLDSGWCWSQLDNHFELLKTVISAVGIDQVESVEDDEGWTRNNDDRQGFQVKRNIVIAAEIDESSYRWNRDNEGDENNSPKTWPVTAKAESRYFRDSIL